MSSVPSVAQYPINPVPFTSVKVSDAFWSPRLKASRDVTVPLAFDKCEETGRYTNFTNAAKCMANPAQEYPDTAWTFTFDDTDPYKTIEGASYLLQTYPKALYHGRPLDKYVDSVIAVIASGQEPDGYLYTPRTKAPHKPHSWAGDKRWEKVEIVSHATSCPARIPDYLGSHLVQFLPTGRGKQREHAVDTITSIKGSPME